MTSNIALVGTEDVWVLDDENHCNWTCTDTYVVTNPAWNKRLSELENWDTDSGTPGWAASFIAYMEDELLAAAPRCHPYDCDVSDPKLGHKSDRYYFEVTWF